MFGGITEPISITIFALIAQAALGRAHGVAATAEHTGGTVAAHGMAGHAAAHRFLKGVGQTALTEGGKQAFALDSVRSTATVAAAHIAVHGAPHMIAPTALATHSAVAYSGAAHVAASHTSRRLFEETLGLGVPFYAANKSVEKAIHAKIKARAEQLSRETRHSGRH
jgi:hypothetical protein